MRDWYLVLKPRHAGACALWAAILAVEIAFMTPIAVLSQTHAIEEPYRIVPPGYKFSVEYLSSEQIRSSATTTCITGSRLGFLWIATKGDVTRFDGNEGKYFEVDPADRDAKLTNETLQILEDRSGILWAGTMYGLKRLDPGSDRFVRYRGTPDDPNTLPGRIVSAVYEDIQGTLWIGTGEGGVAKFDRESSRFVRYFRSGPALRFSSVLSFSEDHSGILWMGTMRGLFTYDRGLDRFAEFIPPNERHRLRSSDTVVSMLVDRRNNLWVGTLAGLLCYDPSSGILKKRYIHNLHDPGSIASNQVLRIVEDTFGHIWMIVMGRGLDKLDVDSGTFQHFATSPEGALGAFQNSVQCLYAEPPSENKASTSVWFGNFGGKIGRIIVRRIQVTQIVTPGSDVSTVTSRGSALWSLLVDSKGRLWAGRLDGVLQCLVRRTNKAYTFTPDPTNPTGLRPGPISQTYEDPWGTIWVLGGGRMHRYDEARHLIQRAPLDVFATCVCLARNGEHWLGCIDTTGKMYLAQWDPRTGRLDRLSWSRSDTLVVPDISVSQIYEDVKGLLWIGTYSGGVYSYDRRTREYQKHLSSSDAQGALKSTRITGFLEDSSGTMWISTHHGLHKRAKGSDLFERIETPSVTRGDPEGYIGYDFIRSMTTDRKGYFWLAVAHNVVQRFDPRTGSFRWYREDEGLKQSFRIHYDRKDDLLYVTGFGPILSFHPDSISGNMSAPMVVLTRFKVFEKDVRLARDVSVLDKIVLPYSDNFFSFTFSALDLTNPSKNLYAYRLEGFDKDWIQSGYRRYASYTNVDPGTYVFRVKGSNNNGIWSETGASIIIVITPPWWRTFWAYAGSVLLLGAVLYTFWCYDRKRVQLRHQLQMKDFETRKLQEIDQLKSQFFANISHEFRTPLTLILGPIDQLASRFKTEEVQTTLAMMRRNGLRLLQLINQLLDLSRIAAGRMSVQVRQMDLVALARPLVMSFISLAERKKIRLIFDPEEEKIVAYVDGDKVEKILTNLLSNALKFTGEGGEVKASLHRRDNRWAEIIVDDTGIGIASEEFGRIFDRFYQVDSAHTREHGGTGIGLALTKELVEMHKGKITVASMHGKGSTFMVSLPLGKEHWRPEDIAAEEPIPKEVGADTLAAVLAENEQVEPEETWEESDSPVVLIVDDNADVRRYVRGSLQECYRIEEAENGKTGLAKVHERAIDLVITDVMMPAMDGLQFCKELKNDERTSHIPVIMLTAKASEDSKLNGLHTGADDYIVKPFDSRELIVRTTNLIELRRKLRKKYQQQVVLGPAEIPVTSSDERFLRKLAQAIEGHIMDAEYHTERLAYDMCMSRMQLNRKLRALTGYSTHELVREFRLLRAAELLGKHAGNVSEVALDVGFSSLSHFIKAFRERFGVVPSDYKANGPERPCTFEDAPSPGSHGGT